MSKPLAVGIACWFALSLAIFFAVRSVDAPKFVSLAQSTKNAADDQAKQYWIARRNVVGSDARDAYAHARLAADLYLQAGDEENYRKWKRIARDLPASDSPTAPSPETNSSPPPAVTVAPPQALQDNQQFFRERDQALQDQRVHDAMEASRAAGEKQHAEEARLKALGDAEAKAASDGSIKAAKNKKFHDAVESNQPRPWQTLGGKNASRAKIIGYDKGVFTLEKADGKQVELRESRMTKADKDYCEEWLSKAGITD